MISPHMVAWPSGKAGACKASIPSSNLGATFFARRDKTIYTTNIQGPKSFYFSPFF